MDDTILRLFPIDCGGLPSAARKRSERAKSFSCPAVIMIVSSLACHAEPERRSVVEDSPPSGNPVSPAPTHQKSIIYNALRASKCPFSASLRGKCFSPHFPQTENGPACAGASAGRRGFDLSRRSPLGRRWACHGVACEAKLDSRCHISCYVSLNCIQKY